MGLRPVLSASVVVLAAAVLPQLDVPNATAADERLHFSVDNGETLQSGTTVTDTSGNDYDGKVRTANGGALRVSSGTSNAVRFPRPCSTQPCPVGLIEVADRDGLDPGYAPFSWRARVLLQRSETSAGANLVQKGLWGNPGGQWKLQVDGEEGKPSCVVSGKRDGTYRRAIVKSSVTVADGKWHTVMCRRTTTTVAILVDGVVKGSATMAAVLLSSTANVTIGAKSTTAEDPDQYHGVLDDVVVRLD
ncbi:MAG: LamG domain-containing protein [Actinomycetota bacterium]|nr:LamG domain-containing protein [Actinomycetota bacterium]